MKRWAPRPLAAGVLGLVVGAAPAHGQQWGSPMALRNAVIVAGLGEATEPGPAEIVGVVTSEEHRADGSIVLTILGVEVVVPAGVPTYRTDLAQRLDEKRPETQLTTSLFGRPLTIGGEVRNR